MVEITRNPVRIDLSEFKFHIHLKKIQLTLHFNSPSRRFYLSVIALVVNEMKRLGKIISIPMEGHLGLLVLLNETIGGSAGSSDKENLLPRIYRKWKDALPDLEDAPLFKVLGRRKEYDEGSGRAYPFTEAEKDSWANLFEYQGSEVVNVRKAMRLTPYYQANILPILVTSCFLLKRYDDAIWAGEELLGRCRKGEMPLTLALPLVATYWELGQEEKARKLAAEIIRSNPKWTLEQVNRVYPFRIQSDMDRLLNAGRNAGLPD